MISGWCGWKCESNTAADCLDGLCCEAGDDRARCGDMMPMVLHADMRHKLSPRAGTVTHAALRKLMSMKHMLVAGKRCPARLSLATIVALQCHR